MGWWFMRTDKTFFAISHWRRNLRITFEFRQQASEWALCLFWMRSSCHRHRKHILCCAHMNVCLRFYAQLNKGAWHVFRSDIFWWQSIIIVIFYAPKWKKMDFLCHREIINVANTIWIIRRLDYQMCQTSSISFLFSDVKTAKSNSKMWGKN